MSDHKKAGSSLIYGSPGAVLTMSIHPTGASPHFFVLSGIAHGLALVSVLFLFLGALGLARFLNSSGRLSLVALVTYSFALVAVFIAATVSGFIMPNVMNMMSVDVPSSMAQWRIVIASLFQVNQAFSKIYAVGGAAAIMIWSLSCLRLNRLSRPLALYGCISTPLIVLLILVGHLRLNVHGFAAVVLSQVVWFVGVGLRLRREDENSTAAARESF